MDLAGTYRERHFTVKKYMITNRDWLQMSNRSGMRQRYHIDGSCCGDCCTALCCHACELTQEQRELALEEQSIERQGVLAY